MFRLSFDYIPVCPLTYTQLKASPSPSQLVLDLLLVHLVHNVDSGLIISFHPTLDHLARAGYLHDHIRFVGKLGHLFHSRLYVYAFLGQSVYCLSGVNSILDESGLAFVLSVII